MDAVPYGHGYGYGLGGGFGYGGYGGIGGYGGYDGYGAHDIGHAVVEPVAVAVHRPVAFEGPQHIGHANSMVSHSVSGPFGKPGYFTTSFLGGKHY